MRYILNLKTIIGDDDIYDDDFLNNNDINKIYNEDEDED